MDTRSRFLNALARGHVPEVVRLRLRPARGPQGQPVVVGGDRSVVARMKRSDGASRAIRIPLVPEAGEAWLRHYRAVAQSRPVGADRWLPRDIEVLERGITVGTAVLPAVVMEWIEGPTLLQAADRAAMHGNGAVLIALAEAVRDLADGLREMHLAHGDLAADNLIVRRDGRVTAVDLDTLTWAGGPGRRMGEASASVRFPGGEATGAQEDAFAALVLYVSLKVLADAPRARDAHGDRPGTHGGALLFSAWDLADPASSRTFRDLRPQLRPESRRLLDLLRDACLGRPTDLPGLLAAAASPGGTGWAEPPREPEVETAPEVNGWDLSRVIERMRAEPPWPVEAPLSESEPFGEVPDLFVPDDLAADRQRLRDAIAAGDHAAIIRQAVRLADDPVAQLYKLEVERALAVRYRGRIADAARRQADDQVLRLAEEVRERALPLDAASRKSVRASSDRLEVRTRLERALTENDHETLADLAVSGALVVLGDTDRSTLQRVLQAIEWPMLERAIEADDDRLILEAFDEEVFDAGRALPSGVHDRVMLARDRQAWLAQVRRALKSRDVDALERLSASVPAGGMQALSNPERARAERLVRRRQALDQLERAVRSGTDTRILAALHEVEASGARIEDRMTWTTVRNVVERASLVEQIVAAARANPVDDRTLAHLLPVAKKMGLMADPAFQGDHAWSRLEALVIRGAAVRRIRRALETDDDRMIRQAAWPDVAGAVAALTDRERARVEAAMEQREAG